MSLNVKLMDQRIRPPGLSENCSSLNLSRWELVLPVVQSFRLHGQAGHLHHKNLERLNLEKAKKSDMLGTFIWARFPNDSRRAELCSRRFLRSRNHAASNP
jgi:hypothetical protein